MKYDSYYTSHTRTSYYRKALSLAAVCLLALLLIVIFYIQFMPVQKAGGASSLLLTSQSAAEVYVATEEAVQTLFTQENGDIQTVPTALASPVASASQDSLPQFSLAPFCFSGDPDYAYNDSRLAIHIQKKQETNIVYFICDIQTTDPTALRTALSGDKTYGDKEHTTDIAVRNGAVLAINGDCYSFHSHGTIIRDGKIVRSNKTTRHLLMLNTDGDLSIITDRKSQDPKTLGDMLINQNITQTWEFGPELIRDGQVVSLKSDFDLLSIRDNVLEPRTAIGQIGPLHYVIIVVDGRISGYSDGASLTKLQRLFKEAGAQIAFNLDGGGSTTLYFNGTVINRPSGGHERSVSDIIYF